MKSLLFWVVFFAMIANTVISIVYAVTLLMVRLFGIQVSPGAPIVEIWLALWAIIFVCVGGGCIFVLVVDDVEKRLLH